jgi:DNA polymerase I-like protein with 3'-5' exonuclease and polymerase domains
MATHGVDVFKPTWYDTLIGEGVLPSASRRDVKKNLQATLARRLKVSIKKTKGMSTSPWMAHILDDGQLEYCAEDIQFLPALMASHYEKVGEGTRERDALDFEMDLMPVTTKMVLNGLPFDFDEWDNYRDDQVEIIDHVSPILEHCLGDVNLGSHVQLKKAFNERFGIQLESTDAEHIAEAAEDARTYEILKDKYDAEGVGPVVAAGALLLWKAANKRYTMYDPDWVQKYVSKDGRAHARFWQCGTETGRYSSSDPNLQQIPQDGRRMFGGLAGHQIVSVDFSQLEVRVAASIANDADLVAALDTGDIHTQVAAAIFKVPVGEISKKDPRRNIAKAATFTLIFGGSAMGLQSYARQFGSHLSMGEAQRIVTNFYGAFPALARHAAQARVVAQSTRYGGVHVAHLPTGMRRILRAAPATQILNTYIQGSAAAGMKSALMEADRRGLTKYIGATVHDELVAAVPDSEVADFTHELEEAMVAGMAEVIDVPVAVESAVGKNWSK